MRSLLGCLVIIGLGMGFCGTTGLAQTDGSVELNADILDYVGRSGTDHYTVAWVTKADGTFIKTIWKQGESSFNDSEWRDHCRSWWDAKNGSTAFDGFSSATARSYNPPNSPVIQVWNCRDASNNLVPDGDYKFWIQYAENSGVGPVTTDGLLWTKSPGNGSITTPYSDQDPNFSDMTVVWSPILPPTPSARITSTEILGGNLIIKGTGTVSTAYTVIGTSDLNQPVDSWTPFGSGSINAFGSFSNSIPVDSGAAWRYYRLRMP